MQPFLVDWWAERLYHERQAIEIAHQQRLLSPELLAMNNRVHTYRWVNEETQRVAGTTGFAHYIAVHPRHG